MQHLEVSGVVRHIYMYMYIVQQLRVNKLLLLHLVVVYIIYILLCFLRLAKQSQFNPYPENMENMVSS